MRRDGSGDRSRAIARVLSLCAEGQLSRAMRILHSSGLLRVTEGVLAQLCRKHPAREHFIPAALPGVFSRVQVSLEESFRRLRRHRATGISGRRAEYLIALTMRFQDFRARQVMPLYDAFATAAINAELPSWFYLIWGTARLVALPKPLPTDPAARALALHNPPARPIAIGEVDLCAIMAETVRIHQPAAADYLAPQQVSVGISGGLSIVVHGLRLLLTELQPGFVCVRIDLRNAYNETDRASALCRLLQVPALAHMAPFIHALGGPEGHLMVQDGTGFRRLFAR